MAVVGVGHMGRFHARKVRELPETELAAVVELDPARRIERARELGVPGVASLAEVVSEIDAAVVAVPTVAHAKVVGEALALGLDVLVEKPIAATLAEAEKLLAQARECGSIVQVGHLEWFNSAMQRVADQITRPAFIESHRLGPFPHRATDVDVVRDLMIHDLDLVQRMVGEEPERIESIGVAVVTSKVDIANARLSFPGGCIANLTASRVSPQPMRKLRFFQPDGYVSVDLLDHSITLAHRGEPDSSGQREVHLQRIEIDRGDALEAQLRSFCEAIRTRRVLAGAADQGLAALRSALRVVEAMPSLELE